MKSENQDGRRVCQGSSEVCAECPLQSRCCQSAKAVYSKRKTIVEPVFGQINNSGFRGFSVRGKEKVTGEFSLVCAIHNFKNIAKAIFIGLIRSELGNFATNEAI